MLYEFYYPDYKITQIKRLITHENYLIGNVPKDEEWFTDKSPYFYAIETGIVKANGEHKVIVKNLLND